MTGNAVANRVSGAMGSPPCSSRVSSGWASAEGAAAGGGRWERSGMNPSPPRNGPLADPSPCTVSRASTPAPSIAVQGSTTSPPGTVCSIQARGTRVAAQVATTRS